MPSSCNTCGHCGKVRKCAKCKATAYCSVECQMKDWPEHKLHCNSSMYLVKKKFNKYHSIFQNLLAKYTKQNLLYMVNNGYKFGDIMMFTKISTDEIDKLVAKDVLGAEDISFINMTYKDMIAAGGQGSKTIANFIDLGNIDIVINIVYAGTIIVDNNYYNAIGCVQPY